MPDGVIFLQVDYTPTPLTQTVATLERGPSSSGPWRFLREVPLVAEVGVTYDTTMPLGEDVWYRWTGDRGDQQIIQGPYQEAAPEGVLLKDPVRPWANLEFSFCASASQALDLLCAPGAPEFVWARFGNKLRRSDAGLFDRLDSETPADVFARRKSFDEPWRFFTRSLEALNDVYTLFTAGGPILIQAPAEYGHPNVFMQPLDLDEQYLTDGIDQRLPYRVWDVPATVVDPVLAGPVQGTVCANWCFVEETYPTFADLTAAGGTYLDLASGVTQCPDGPPPGDEDGFGLGLFGDGPFGDGG